MLTPYTTNEQVRAAIGVSADEISDDTLGLEMYGVNLEFELGQIGDPANGDALAAAFVIIAAKDPNVRTTEEKALYNAVILYAPYVVALQLEPAAPLFAMKEITDGKAGITRHSDSPFQAQFDRARQLYERYRQNLARAWADYNDTGEPVEVGIATLLAVSSPSSDPVTGT